MDIMNAIMYMVKTGCQWRMLPKDFPPYNTVFYYFNKWKLEGVFEELMDTLHVAVRKQMGREDTPSFGISSDACFGRLNHLRKLNYSSHRTDSITLPRRICPEQASQVSLF